MESQKQKFNMSYYVHIFQRRKWFFIVPLVMIYISFLVSSYFLPKVYEAKAIILIEDKKVVNPLLKNLAVSSDVTERLHTLREEILAWPRLYQLVERLDLNKNARTPLELERLIHSIRRSIILTMKSQDVVMIAYQGRDRHGTQKLVNTLSDILIERNISLINEDTGSAIDFIEEQLAIYKGKLDQSEAALRQFKEVYGLEVLPQLQQTTNASVLEESAGFTAPLVHISTELANLEAELVIASVDCTDEHPRIKDIKRRIASLKEKRDQYIGEAAKRTGVDPQLYVDIAGSLPRQQEELARLSRDKAINGRIYAMLLERLESANITERLDNSENRTKFRIIEPARLPLIPIKPNKAKLNLLGLILGGMVGFGFTYLLEYTDSSFKNAEEIKKSFDQPVLGSISKIITDEDIEQKRKFKKKMFVLMVILTLLATLASILIVRVGANFVNLGG
ncbi:MAG: hypothetical protein JSW40_06875 [Candidatus Omnitrophota bacterium]|nr:MAG: hypothetical protein JSW40_06875 [Candidatus Omnitrophota bacterium]